jgi:serine protease Do
VIAGRSSLLRLGLVLILGTASVPAAARDLPDFSRLVRSQAAVVVNISTTQQIVRAGAARRPDAPLPEDHPLGDWLRRFGEGGPDSLDGSSLGSGVIISADGFILTCGHVVEDAQEIMVRLNDRREFSARLVGADRRSDLALLKIDAAALPRALIGDPGKLAVGDWVLAIGSPFGFDSSATAGIVSAKSRSLPKENYVTFLQTDVAINPGNSGGPLFNLKGEVIGINSQIYSETGGYMGVSFAIPIDTAMRVVDQLKADGRVHRGWLGVRLQEVTRDLALAYGMPKPAGALIADILPGGPAARSDLRVGDVVVDFEDKPVERSSDLAPLVGLTAPGARARVTVFRREQGRQTLLVSVAELKEDGIAKSTTGLKPRPASNPGGLVLGELGAAQRRRLNLEHGVAIEGVEEGGARTAGLRPGDVVLEIDGKRVSTVADAQRLLAQLPRERPVVLRIQRGPATSFVALRLDG